MIFCLSEQFCRAADPLDLCDVCRGVIARRHFLKADTATRQIINDAVERHGGTRLQKLWKTYRSASCFRPSAELTRNLTTIDFDDDGNMARLIYLANAKAYVFIENSNYEWPVYQRMAQLYSRDPAIRNLAQRLSDAMERRDITGKHCGGRDEILPTYQSTLDEENCPKDFFDLKTLTIFDRDTDDNHTYCNYNNQLFGHFCVKDHTTVTDSDIYTLSQTPPRWHMWYRRSIENYFDKGCYTACNVDISAAPEGEAFYYFKIDKGSCRRYKKSNLSKLADYISRERLENGLAIFNERGQQLSELQLFILKLVKII